MSSIIDYLFLVHLDFGNNNSDKGKSLGKIKEINKDNEMAEEQNQSNIHDGILTDEIGNKPNNNPIKFFAGKFLLLLFYNNSFILFY